MRGTFCWYFGTYFFFFFHRNKRFYFHNVNVQKYFITVLCRKFVFVTLLCHYNRGIKFWLNINNLITTYIEYFKFLNPRIKVYQSLSK